MKVGTALVALSLNAQADWSDRRERRHAHSRRAEDRRPTVQPSLGFLTQVVNQTVPDTPGPSLGYAATPRWRCGVCADEKA